MKKSKTVKTVVPDFRPFRWFRTDVCAPSEDKRQYLVAYRGESGGKFFVMELRKKNSGEYTWHNLHDAEFSYEVFDYWAEIPPLPGVDGADLLLLPT